MRLSMKRAKRFISLFLLWLTLLPAGFVNAISKVQLYEFGQNNILFYDPEGCVDGASNLQSYNNLTIGEAYASNLVDVVKQYGELAMDLQREWGTPWEVVFAQMQIESQVGTDGVAVSIARNGYYNWLGITGNGGSLSIGEPYVSSNGKHFAQYPSVENMIKAWAGTYIARNGYYDKAFSHLDPNAYDIRGFLNDFILVYAPPVENDTSRYITGVMSLLNGTIKQVREEMGWPSSEELAKNENIPIGGRHPLGSSSGGGGSSSAGGCTKLTSSPDYNESGYQGRLSNLHDFSQTRSMFKDYKMCEGQSYTIYYNGCGIMSVYAAYYMFSGQGLNDATVFEEFLEKTRADSGYNQCSASDVPSLGSNVESFTQMQKNVLFDKGSYSEAGDRWSELVSALQGGNKVIILVASSDGSIFANSGHYLMLDHYNSEKNMIFMFDPAMGDNRAATVAGYSDDYIQAYNGSAFNGVYVSQAAMNGIVKPKEATALSYDGCYNGGNIVDKCRPGGGTTLKTGGMTYEEAVSFMMRYRNEAAYKKFGDYGAGYANGAVIGDGYVGDAGCHDGTLNNCVAFSRWFVNNYTTAGPKSNAGGDGQFYASSLISSDGFQDGGTVPTAYAIFSKTGGEYGHTGVVLGINQEDDEIYIGEAGCTAGFTDTWPGVHKYSLSDYASGAYNYAYPGEKLKLGGL